MALPSLNIRKIVIKKQLFDFLQINQTVYKDFSLRVEQSLHVALRYLWIQKILYKLLPSKSKNKKYLFYSLKYQELIKTLPKDDVLLLGGGKSAWLFSIRTKIPILFIYPFFKILLPLFKSDKYSEIELEKSVNTLSQLLKSTSAEYLIVETDSLPHHRLLIMAARKASIQSICILHGVSSYACVGSLSDGQFADYMLVYDDYQKNVLKHAGINPDKLFILGYYASLSFIKPKTYYDRKTICILGQPWIHYDNAIFRRYEKIIEWLIETLSATGLNIVYKPHPGENDYAFIHKLSEEIEIFSNDLTSCFQHYDVFISFASTAILEATLHTKIAIQIYDGQLYDDRLEDAGYCRTITFGDTETLIENIKHSLPLFNSQIIQYSQKPISERFKQVLTLIHDTANKIPL